MSELVVGGYTITGRIHEGTRTYIYRGHRSGDRRPVILKALKLEHPGAQDLAHLRHEYGILSELAVPAAVTALALEKLSGGGLAIVMEELEGQTLAALLKEAGRLDLPAALELGIAIAEAIGAVHRRQVTHKDIKPSNIFISPDRRRARLIDFGIATRLEQELPPLAGVGALEGTLAYMAPEQTGRMSRAVDRRADLYAFGVTLHEMLTGVRPFSAVDPMEVLHSHLARLPIPPHERRLDIPVPVSEIVMRLLAKSPEDRYQSAHGVRADLAECLRRLRHAGEVQGFPLGRQDRSHDLRIPQKNYGRDAERAILLGAFARARQGKAELLLVSGSSGVGKSALVHEGQRAITRTGGHFVHGKFDQLSRSAPYASVAQALRELIRRILAEPAGSLRRWRSALAEALGPSAGLLIEFIPELGIVLGPQPAVPPVGPSEAQNRFDLVFRSFLRALTGAEHPLVLFLDDLQWADAASLRLLRLLLTDAEIGHLLVIGAYRDNEAGPAHPLAITVDAIRKAGAAVTEVPLAPLEPAHLTELLADALGCPAADVAALAALVHGKTRGNPFFVGQFLRSLGADGLLRCDPEAGRWSWDQGAIAARAVTDNVVDFMIAKLQRFSPAAQRALQLAACVGHRFDLRTLATIQERSAAETARDLWEALDAGLVIPLDPAYRLLRWSDEGGEAPPDEAAPEVSFQFLHDRVQQAAYALIAEDHRREVHLRIGRLMLASQGGEPREEQLFEVVNHLSAGAQLLTDAAAREELARLCLRAGRKAKASAAYSAAAEHLAAGRGALGERGAARNPALGWALTIEAAECEYLCGRFAEAEALFTRLLEIARSDIDRAQVYSLRMKLYPMAGRYDESVKLGQTALRLFGVELPDGEEELNAAIGAELAQIPGNMAGRSVEALLDAPHVEDPRVLAIIGLLSDCCPCAYIGRPPLFPLLPLKMVNLSLRHGSAEASCYAYGIYAVMLVGVSGDIAAAYRFSELAIQLNDRLGGAALRGTLLHLQGDHVYFWRHPFRAVLPLLERAFLACLEVGDLVYANGLAFQSVWQMLEAGSRLADVLGACARSAAFARQTGNEPIHQTILLEQQFCRALQGLTRPDALLSDDGCDEQRCLEVVVQAGFGCGVAFYHILRLILLYAYGRPAEALAAADAARPALGAVMAMPIEATYHFHLALTLLALGEPDVEEERLRRREALEGSIGKLARWAEHCPDNFLSKHLLVLAEQARAAGRDLDAIELYDRAIEAARQGELPHVEALASELAGAFYVARGRKRVASLYLAEAAQGYQQAGAAGKAADLARRYGRLALGPRSQQDGATVATLSTTTTGPILQDALLEVGAVLQTAHAISSELVLDKALERVLRAVLSSAGAQRCFLVLDRGGPLSIEASITVEPDVVQVGLAQPLEGSADLPVSVVQYVARTRELVLLDSAAEGSPFADDPYIAAFRPRSLLALALVHQGRLTGVLYVENTLASGTFAPERIELLRLLCVPIAAALENALLYARLSRASAELHAANERLEIEVGRRTAELTAANERLSHQAEALNEANTRLLLELGERERAEQARAALQQQIIEVQRARLAETATPLIPITDRLIVMPLIGTMDAARAQQVLEAALGGVQRYSPDMLILDITGLKHVDAGVADTLLRTASAVRLLGARAVLTGIQPHVARTLVELGVDLQAIVTHGTLQSAVTSALARPGERRASR